MTNMIPQHIIQASAIDYLTAALFHLIRATAGDESDGSSIAGEWPSLPPEIRRHWRRAVADLGEHITTAFAAGERPDAAKLAAAWAPSFPYMPAWSELSETHQYAWIKGVAYLSEVLE